MAGQGDFPLRSAWLGRGRGRGRGAQPRRVVNIAAYADFGPAVWTDWAFDAAPSGAVTGTIAATETGSDTAALSGNVLVSGAINATESGSDTAALAGLVTGEGIVWTDDGQPIGTWDNNETTQFSWVQSPAIMTAWG